MVTDSRPVLKVQVRTSMKFTWYRGSTLAWSSIRFATILAHGIDWMVWAVLLVHWLGQGMLGKSCSGKHKHNIRSESFTMTMLRVAVFTHTHILTYTHIHYMMSVVSIVLYSCPLKFVHRLLGWKDQ